MSKLDNLMKNPFDVVNNTSSDYVSKDYQQLNKEFDNEKPKTEINKKRKAFLTDVELEEGLTNFKKGGNDMYENFLLDEDISMYTKEQINEAREFENMIRDVDNMRTKVKGEFDQLQYLIKYVKDTKNKVNRHMYGVKNLADQSGVKKKIDPLTSIKKGIDGVVSEDEEEDENIYDENGDYNKELNLEKVAANIFNIQDNVIGYHQNFAKNMSKVEENNALVRKILGSTSEGKFFESQPIPAIQNNNKISYNNLVGQSQQSSHKYNSNNTISTVLTSTTAKSTGTDFSKEVKKKLRNKSSNKY